MTSSAQIALITGANQGIGFYIAQILAESSTPYVILVGARDPSRGEEAVKKLVASTPNTKSTISTIQVDVTSSSSIHAAVDKISTEHGRLDILVNNAGVGSHNGSAEKRADWEHIFNVNVFGLIEMTQACLPLLEKSSNAKCVIVSSSMGSMGWTESMGEHPMGAALMPYSASKSAAHMILVQWHKYIKNVKFWGVDPGLCATEFGGEFTKNYGRNPREGADIVRQCVEGERDEHMGKVFWQENGEGVRPW